MIVLRRLKPGRAAAPNNMVPDTRAESLSALSADLRARGGYERVGVKRRDEDAGRIRFANWLAAEGRLSDWTEE